MLKTLKLGLCLMGACIAFFPHLSFASYTDDRSFMDAALLRDGLQIDEQAVADAAQQLQYRYPTVASLISSQQDAQKLTEELNATKDTSKQAEFYFYLAELAMKNKDYDNAIANYENSLTVKPDSVPASYGKIMAIRAKYTNPRDRATFLVPESLLFTQRHKKSAVGYALSVEENLAAKNYYSVIRDAKTLLSMTEDKDLKASVHNKRGLAYVKIKAYNFAYFDFSGAETTALREHSKQLSIFRNNLAMLAIDGGENKYAIRIIDSVLQVNSNLPYALDTKGLALSNLGNYAEAVTYFDKAIALDNHSDEFYINRGYAYAMLKQTDKARADYNAAIALGGENRETALQRLSSLDK
jgi:tetratricopeptide (TPR) repeat protein